MKVTFQQEHRNLRMFNEDRSYYCTDFQYELMKIVATNIQTIGYQWWDLYIETSKTDYSIKSMDVTLPSDFISHIDMNREKWSRLQKLEIVLS